MLALIGLAQIAEKGAPGPAVGAAAAASLPAQRRRHAIAERRHRCAASASAARTTPGIASRQERRQPAGQLLGRQARQHLAAQPGQVRGVGVRGAAPEAREREALGELGERRDLLGAALRQAGRDSPRRATTALGAAPRAGPRQLSAARLSAWRAARRRRRR